MNVSNIVSKITSLHVKKELQNFSFENMNNNDILSILIKLTKNISNGSVYYDTNNKGEHKNYKLTYYSDMLDFIVNHITKLYNSSDEKKHILDFLKDTLLEKITTSCQGQKLLDRLYNIIIVLPHEYLIDRMLYIASKSGTIITFLFWLKLSKYKEIQKLPILTLEDIIIDSIGNSDDRLFKFMLDAVLKNNKLFLQQNTSTINKMISSLHHSLVPPKYILRRIKMLSTYISLTPYFNHMIGIFTNEKVLLELHKYYYVVPYTYNSLDKITNRLLSTVYSDTVIKKLYDILKTDEERIMLYIIALLKKCYLNINTPIQTKLYTEIICNNFNDILNIISYGTLSKQSNIMNIIKILSSYNLINKYIENNIHNMVTINTSILLLSRFLDTSNLDTKHMQYKRIININMTLHRLRLLAKKKAKAKITNHTVKMFNIINEIKTFEPKSDINILKNGSRYYQVNKQKFTNLPPRHIMPGELTIYNSFLLREKADGILINNLPIDIYPMVHIMNNHMIKAEYIEDLDLYLVFDIDIPNTTIIERYNILRKSHNYTNNLYDPFPIKTLDCYNKIQYEEHININKFLKENKQNTIKWYPKFACIYDHTDNMTLYRQLIEDIIITNKTKSDTIYNNDGIILSPLNGDREIKIKPKSLMTIDLLYNNNMWLDRSNTDWSHLITNTMKVKPGGIYRCYPKDNMFVVDSYRYDKKQPNPNNIVDLIINMTKYDWNNDLKMLDTYYYIEKKQPPKKIIEMLQMQTKLLGDNITLMNPMNNKNWLDLGCGSGKSIQFIKKYNPMNYLGLDIDIKQLVCCLKYHDMNQDVYKFTPDDLNNNFVTNPQNNRWYTINNKYDYIVANFSLMHFFTDSFWEQLNQIVHEDSIFIFSIVDTMNDVDWSESKSFLKVDGNKTEYMFEWVHDNIMTEPHITNKQLEETISKYGWKILSRNKYNMNKLVESYEWFILAKTKFA
jgi:SAM-dependent methyltransferase